MSNIHKEWRFSKSRAILGSIGPVTRARVMELVSEDADKPASPPARVIWLNVCFVVLKLGYGCSLLRHFRHSKEEFPEHQRSSRGWWMEFLASETRRFGLWILSLQGAQ